MARTSTNSSRRDSHGPAGSNDAGMPIIRTGPRDPDSVRDLATAAGGLLLPSQLAAAGVSRARRRAQCDASRWEPQGPRRPVLLPNDADATTQRAALALAEVGAGARLGGVSALAAAGMSGYEEPTIHVWVPKSSSKADPEGVTVHETRRWDGQHAVDGAGLPRSKPEVAAVQGALWATSRRQALLVLTMAVQQRIASAQLIRADLERVRRHPFRTMLQAAMLDIIDGAHSLNELDFAALCREFGVPEADRQVVARGSQGRIYLDVRWRRYGICVEVNGAGHDRLDQAMKDEVRAIDIQLAGDAAVTVGVLTLRCDPAPFMAALKRLLVARGWQP